MENISVFSSLEDMKKELERINRQMEELENTEPANESSWEHKTWEETCEKLAVESETVMTWIDRKMAEGI